MIEVNATMVAAICGIFGLALSVVTMWVKFTNDITRNAVKVEDLTGRVSKVEGTLTDHDQRINNALTEIKDGIHRIELEIANKKT